MRVSELFGKTQRETPAEADIISHQLLLRAGMISQVAAGIYSYMPLAWRVLNKIENIIRDEMNKAGGQELTLPVLQPLELWQETGRAQSRGKNLFTLTDRRERPLVLGPTHEEVLTQLVIRNVQSYRDLPKLIYQIQVKFRDEPRPRGGPIRAREFHMKDLYSFDADEAGLDESYNKMLRAYKNIYDRCGLPSIPVEADSGDFGGKESHEFMLLTESGENEIIYCPTGDYTANAEKAESVKEKIDGGQPLPLEEVATPGMTSIEEVSDFLGIPRSHTLKAVFYISDGEFVFVVIRGDLDVNDIKLQNALHCYELRLATEEEVIEAGIVPGFTSPVGITDIRIVADDSVPATTNLVGGANKPDTHVRNVNYDRDFKSDIVADVTLAKAGDTCLKCGHKLESTRGIEVGHIFKLGTLYSEKLGAFYVDERGEPHPIVMGCYGIGLGRLMAAAIEQSHDDEGIIWPLAIAPYQVYLCPLYREDTDVSEVAETLYTELENEGIEALFDDRRESPGVKFNDADLLGIPIRVTVSPRTLEKASVEIKLRPEKDSVLIPMVEVVAYIRTTIKGASPS
jgi:prolyl-tRNA synthetase